LKNLINSGVDQRLEVFRSEEDEEEQSKETASAREVGRKTGERVS